MKITYSSILESIRKADEKINTKAGYRANDVIGWYRELIRRGSVEVGWRECCGRTDPSAKSRSEWLKIVKKLERAGFNLRVESVKHGNAWATLSGGFWNSEVFTLAGPIPSEFVGDSEGRRVSA